MKNFANNVTILIKFLCRIYIIRFTLLSIHHENKQSTTLGLFFCGENGGNFYSLIKGFDI